MTSDGSTPHMDSDEEELMRMRYFEALRRQHFEEQMRQMQLKERESSNKQPFRTPNVISFNYEDLYSYGSEVNTASANYRPGNSNTLLRRRKNPPKTISTTKN
jgi:hypothetical protein